MGISQPAANAALNNLRAAGIVSLVNGRQWGRVFQATDILLEPAKVWTQLKERPTFLVPALVVAGAMALAAVLYFFHIAVPQRHGA